ncbi:MAG: OstA-like protein [Paludibacteraceae bacterium]
MNLINQNNWLTKVMVTLLITFFCFSYLQSQTKPHQLKKEILQSQKATPSEKETQKKVNQPKKKNQALPVGATVFTPANPARLPGAKLVYIQYSKDLFFDQLLHPDVQVLKGDVCFKHDNALLYCDSAYFNDKLNTFDAYSNVRIVQGDTLTAYGDYLNYDGNTKLAHLKYNVKMVNRNTTLYTDSMLYDRMGNLAYYYTGGTIVDGTNTLTSIWGQYSPATHFALFKNDVELKNPDFTLKSDTLTYNTTTKIANIVGKTHIVYRGETDVYSKSGWYNTVTDRMMLLDRSLVKHKEGKSITGDTIFYDKKNKYAESYSNVMMIDTVQKSTIYGHYVLYDEIKEFGLATDSALFVDWSGKDTLYLSADTLENMKDSIYNKVEGFKNVRFFRPDIQGFCDSLKYNARDSILHLNGTPVLWAENNQLMGEKITAYTKNQRVEKVRIEQAAIAIQKDTLNYFNQLSGKEIVAYIDSGEVKKVNVNGNAETIYFPKDEKTRKFVGVNKTLSSFVTAYLKEKKIERIVLTKASSGVMYPLDEMGEDDLYLRYFYWYENERPLKYDDVFTRYPPVERTKRSESKKRPAFPSESGTPQGSTNNRTLENSSQNIPIRNDNNNINTMDTQDLRQLSR